MVGSVTVEGVRFYADRAHTIIVNAQPTNAIVRNLVVTGPSSWTKQQSIAYCQSFLPIGAAAYRTVVQYTYFHSSLGDVALNAPVSGTGERLIFPTVG